MRKSAFIIACVFSAGCSGLISGKSLPGQGSEVAKRYLMAKIPELLPGEIALAVMGESTEREDLLFVYKSEKITGINRNDIIFGEFFKSKKNNAKLAVLLPGKGESISTDWPARTLAERGFDVVRFLAKFTIFDLTLLDRKERFTKTEFEGFAKVVADTFETRYNDYLNIITKLKEANSYSRIGISGVSLGGISAYYLSGAHPEIFQSTVGITTGGDLAGILMSSAESGIERIREEIFKKFGIAEDEALKILRAELKHIDPLSVAKNINPESALLVSNILDSVIPHRFTKKLWEAANRPTWKLAVIKIPIFWLRDYSFWLDGHYSAGLALFVPIPLFEFWGPFLLPGMPSTLDFLIVRHFERTLK
ncbi:MAG: hypothetical protein HYT12_02450 [Candidatus Liptonbacteria bacterium]|nr:hypothetical protein [Candidatus Liptonbacteria bacterium]